MGDVLPIGERVSVWDNRNSAWREAKVIRAETDYTCMRGVEGQEHTHDVVYDVRFSDRISCGHLAHAVKPKESSPREGGAK